MIDQAIVERIVEQAQSQITEIVSDYVNLKRRGVNYIGKCPFHNEKTPSFIVSPSKGIFKCFGCGKGGNAVNFLMEHEQISFVEAVIMLGRRFHITIEEKVPTPEELEQQTERESMMLVTEYAAKFFTKSLYETDEGQSVGLGYLRQRGIRDDIIRKFQLGYSPEQRDALTKHALVHGYKLQYLEKTGLTIVRDDYKADRFRGRVIFPILSLSGKVIGFGGRIIKNDPNTAKYLNSPESEIYHKSRILYGIYQARQEIVRQDCTYLVEGYTDVLSFHQAGICNVVASSGTALTLEQIQLMSRFSHNVTFIFDGDPAGIKASLRGIDMVLAEGMNIKVLLLPDGHDPDSFAKSMSGEELVEYIRSHETDFIRFKTSVLMQDSANDPIKKAQVIQDIIRTISVIPDPIVQSVYVKECSQLLGVEEAFLYDGIRKLKLKEQSRNVSRRPTPSAPQPETQARDLPPLTDNPLENEEREVLRYLIKYGSETLGPVTSGEEVRDMTVGEFIIHEIRQDELSSLNPIHNLILDEYEANMLSPEFVPHRYFVGHPNPSVSTLATDLIAREYRLSRIHTRYGDVKTDEDILDQLVPRIVTELKWKFLKTRIEHLTMEMKTVQEEGNNERLLDLMKEINLLQNALKLISHQHGERTIIK